MTIYNHVDLDYRLKSIPLRERLCVPRQVCTVYPPKTKVFFVMYNGKTEEKHFVDNAITTYPCLN